MVDKPDRSRLVYNEDALKEAAKRPSLPHGWWPFIITDAEEKIGDTEKTMGDMIVIAQCAGLMDINDITSKVQPLMRERITVPADNPDMPGHKAKDHSYGLTARFLRAVYDVQELVPAPYRDSDTKELKYRGKVIEKDEEDSCREEALKEVVDLAEDLFFGCDKGKAKLKSLRDRVLDCKDLKGRLFLGRVGFDKTGDWTNILQYRHVDWGLPEGEVFVKAAELAAIGLAKPAPRHRKKAIKKKKKARK